MIRGLSDVFGGNLRALFIYSLPVRLFETATFENHRFIAVLGKSKWPASPSAARSPLIFSLLKKFHDPSPRIRLNIGSELLRSPDASSSKSNRPNPLLTEFMLFPKLPPELRYIIWRMAVPKLSIMALELDSTPAGFCFRDYSGNGGNLTAILKICRESRQVAKSERQCQHGQIVS